MQNLDVSNVTMKITQKRQRGNQRRAQSANNQHCEAREQVNRGKRKDGWKIWG